MSGGHFEYNQFVLEDIADKIDRLVKNNDRSDCDEYGDPVGKQYPLDVIWRFKETAKLLRKCGKMIHRVDWLVSGDDGVDSFRERWREEIGVDEND